MKLKTSRILPPLILLSAGLLSLLIFHRWATSILRDTSWLHVEKALILARGLPLYRLPDTGPIISAFYGPLSVLPYWPVVWMPSLQWMMVVAQGINMALFFLPPALLFIGERRRSGEAGAVIAAAFCVFAFSVFFISSLRDTAFLVRADAAALCFSGLAVLGLYFRRRGDSDAALILSALAAACAVWAKQITAPLLLALPLYVGLTEGRRSFYKLLIWEGVWLTLLGAVFVRMFGAEELYFNLVHIFSRHPWRSEGIAHTLWKLAKESAWPMVPLMFALRFRDGAGSENRWRLLLWAALFLAPSAFLGKIKIGGSNNAVCYLSYFLLLGSCLALSRFRSERSKRALAVLLAGVLAAGAVIALDKYRRPLIEHDFIETAYRYAKARPGEAYFPRLNVVTLFAEGRLYGDSDAIIDREWAAIPPTRRELEDFLPPHHRLTAFRKGSSDDLGRLRLQAPYSQRMELDELPGFWVYRIERSSEGPG